MEPSYRKKRTPSAGWRIVEEILLLMQSWSLEIRVPDCRTDSAITMEPGFSIWEGFPHFSELDPDNSPFLRSHPVV
jgi:hypothetical protein